MINEITQHIPNFVEHIGIDIKINQFNTTEELLEIEWIKHWSKRGDFQYYMISKEVKRTYLMVQTLSEYWVLGYIKYGTNINLRNWKD